MTTHAPIPLPLIWRGNRIKDNHGSEVCFLACDPAYVLTAHDRIVAAYIVKAVDFHAELVETLEEISNQYENGDINHIDFRVGVKTIAAAILAKVSAS